MYCLNIYEYKYGLSKHICTRILGPPKAGNKNRHKTLIILKSKCLKIWIFDVLELFVFSKMYFDIVGVFCIIN